MDEQQSLFKAIVFGAVGIIGYFLKRLHDKLENAASRDELNELKLKVADAVTKIDFETTVRNLRVEHEADRRELRDNQVKLFDKMDINTQLLTQVVTKVEILLKERGDRHGG